MDLFDCNIYHSINEKRFVGVILKIKINLNNFVFVDFVKVYTLKEGIVMTYTVSDDFNLKNS